MIAQFWKSNSKSFQIIFSTLYFQSKPFQTIVSNSLFLIQQTTSNKTLLSVTMMKVQDRQDRKKKSLSNLFFVFFRPSSWWRDQSWVLINKLYFSTISPFAFQLPFQDTLLRMLYLYTKTVGNMRVNIACSIWSHMASPEMVHVLEHCRIAPPPGSVDGKSLPLTFFDLPWLHFPLMKFFFFYEFSHPKTYFVETIIPRLKHSLSLTLKHFFPLSGNLIFPLDCSIPEIRYKDGDSVSLTFVEGSFDFDHLSGHHQRNVTSIHKYLWPINCPSPSYSSDTFSELWYMYWVHISSHSRRCEHIRSVCKIMGFH